MTSVADLKRKWMRNPEFRKAYEASADTYAKQAKVIEKMKTLGPLEPAVLASAEPLPRPPLRPGQPVRWTVARHGHPNRRRRGIVVSVGWRMVGVLDERSKTIGYHYAEELEPIKYSLAEKLERENKRLRKVIAAVVETRSLLRTITETPETAAGYEDIVAAYWDTKKAADKALAPFELEPT